MTLARKSLMTKSHYTNAEYYEAKGAEWEYESEYRLYLKSSKDSYLDRIAPKSVVIGGRKRRNDSVFEQVCKKYKIKVGSLLELNEGYEVFYPTTI